MGCYSFISFNSKLVSQNSTIACLQNDALYHKSSNINMHSDKWNPDNVCKLNGVLFLTWGTQEWISTDPRDQLSNYGLNYPQSMQGTLPWEFILIWSRKWLRTVLRMVVCIEELCGDKWKWSEFQAQGTESPYIWLSFHTSRDLWGRDACPHCFCTVRVHS